MARCRATPPCEFWDDVHDFGCAARRGFYPDNPELDELYATETATERQMLIDILGLLLDEAGLSGDFDAGDVNSDDVEWLAIRKAIRAASVLVPLTEIARGFHVQLAADGGDSWPVLSIRARENTP